MKKKLVTTLLGASLLLAACGGEKAAEKPAAAEAETIKIGAISSYMTEEEYQKFFYFII